MAEAAMAAAGALLEVRDAVSGYRHGGRVLDGLSLSVARREAVAVIGRNGTGKSTLVKTILGELPLRGGEIRLQGRSIARLPIHKVAALGIGLVPEGRRLFRSLSVTENLVATARPLAAGWTLDEVFALFPRLGERRRQQAWQLSGGEQQMVAIGRALLTNAELLIFDEATEGLAPLIRGELWRGLRAIRARGQAFILIDKHVQAVSALVDRFYVVDKGRVAWEGSSAAFRDKPDLVGRYLALDG